VTGPPEDRNAELRELFFESAQELLQSLNDQALRLEKSPGEADAVRTLRRVVHTLKGDAAACGYRELSELAHELEDALTLDNPETAASVPDIALRAADLFEAILEAYRLKKKLPSTLALRQAIAGLAPTAAATKGKKKAARSAQARWSEYEQLAIRQALAEGKQVYHVSVQLDPQCGMPIAARQMIKVTLAGLGEVLAVYPEEGAPGPLHKLEFALASEKPAEHIRTKCRIPTIALTAGVVALGAKKPSRAVPVPPAPAAEPEPETPAPAAVELAAEPSRPVAEEPSTQTSTSGAENVLRVDAAKIDNVLNLVGELVLVKSMLQQALSEFSQRFPKEPLRGKFSDAMAFQARVLNDLQRSVMKIRMVPVEQLFRRFPRLVRDVSRQCGKEVNLQLKGQDTDLDKGILDTIAEPLTHLVRNAIGHGIEYAEVRVRAGKKPQGTLRLSAYHQANQVVIEVSDDGHGVDAEKVRQRAIAQGLLTSEQAARLSETEILNLIFRPGFSTAEEITELSGRGVGLDVVQSVLQRLKGTVQIETEAGRRTTFRLRLPLTLAIIQALMFRVEQRLYAIPLNTVLEIARALEEDVHQVDQYEVLQLRNDVLPLLRLGRSQSPGADSARRKFFVLVINGGDRKFGLVVDELEGEEELVIKALDDQSISTDLVSGASILGDGRVVLILNLIALLERFTRTRSNGTGSPRSGLLLSGTDRALQAQTTAGGQA
jgi:two-component system chemotaxis sensor kinase CheA